METAPVGIFNGRHVAKSARLFCSLIFLEYLTVVDATTPLFLEKLKIFFMTSCFSRFLPASLGHHLAESYFSIPTKSPFSIHL
jgi:hypothetical protein